MNNENQKSGKCRICKNITQNCVNKSSNPDFLCDKCDKQYFYDLSSNDEKANRIAAVRKFAKREELSVFHAVNVFLGKYNLQEARARIEKKKKVNAMANSKSKNCRICKNLTRNIINNQHFTYYLCETCNKRFFSDLRNPEVKADRLEAAINLSNSENINLLYALNIENGLYNIEEAKRRITLKKSDYSKSTTDIFVVGRRLPGSYK